MTEIDVETAREVAEEHSKPGKFSFLDRLQNREYPAEDVEIFLDEAAGLHIHKLTQELLASKDPEQTEIIEKQIAHYSDKARKSRYTVHMQGISTEAYDAVVDAAREEFPVEYTESRHPLTMAPERREVESESREVYFRTHLWSKFIKSVEDTDGNIDDEISPEWVGAFLGNAPIIAQARIQVALEQLRMTTSWMDEIQGEDFLAKS